MLSEKLKIFPLLILVAMLAFSVRLAEVVSGVRALSSGAAYAEDAPAPDPAALAAPGEKKDAAEPEPEAAAADSKPADEAKAAEAAPAAAKPEDKDHPAVKIASERGAKGAEVIWKDAADSDIDSAQAVKMEMFEDLTKRRDALDSREKDLATREALLKAAEQELDRKYQELETIRTEIKGLLVEQSEEEKARITSLVKIYEGMKPKEAAEIFNSLDIDILVEVMTQMSERKLAPVLAAMDADRARAVTIMMAEQRKLPDLPDSN